MPQIDKTRVLILGGGCGAVSAAYALTRTAEARARFDVALYSQGWRLGGKGASGRNPSRHNQIEEHGLHLFLGFYRTAFGVLHEAYGRLNGVADGVFPSLSAAFTPQRKVTLWASPENGGGGEWRDYTLTAPDWPGKPWEGVQSDLKEAPQRLSEMLRTQAGLANLHHLVSHLETAERVPDEDSAGFLDRFLDDVRDIRDDIALAAHVLFDILEIGGAVLRGYFTDILPHGWDAWDAINEYDFRKWLIKHGASQTAAWSEMIRVLYDLAFAYAGGEGDEEDATSIAAGSCLKLVFDLVAGYRDAPMWRMNAGMGDTVFTPLYKNIVRDGADVHLFHRIMDVHHDALTGKITRVRLQVQARPKAAYNPFIKVKQLDCWPSEPLWDQLENGDALRGINFENPWDHHHVDEVILELGRDFDEVVFGIPPAAAAYITPSLTSNNTDWAKMVSVLGSASVATHSVQLWFDRNTQAAGWPMQDSVSGAYAPSIGTWADMSHLVHEETWPSGADISCQYLIGVVPLPTDLPPITVEDKGLIARNNITGLTLTTEWLDSHAKVLWPDLMNGPVFDQRAIVSAYDHINVAPTELYVRTPPGSVKYRLDPNWDGVKNMVLAGDWTRTSINGGSAEAAMESGKAAAQALIDKYEGAPWFRDAPGVGV